MGFKLWIFVTEVVRLTRDAAILFLEKMSLASNKKYAKINALYIKGLYKRLERFRQFKFFYLFHCRMYGKAYSRKIFKRHGK